MKVLTSLAENSYFYGLAALLNSVGHYGTYVDKIVVGYRDELPDWLPPLSGSTNGRSFTTGSGLQVELVELNGSKHMVHEKPKWFAHLSDNLEPDAEEYFFFDSDIVINKRMSFYGEWVQEGVGMCGDVLFVFDRRHPIRRKWIRVAEAAGHRIVNELDGFYNSGFLGWKQEHKDFIRDWNRAFQLLAPYSGDMQQFRVHDRTAIVQSTNQDSFNLAAMITEVPIAPIGPEAMGFMHGMRLMFHPIGPKPWDRNFTREFVQGRPPREADLRFWEFANGREVKAYPPAKVSRMIKLCKALRLMARSYTGR